MDFGIDAAMGGRDFGSPLMNISERDTEMRGIFDHAKASDLPFETAVEFSDAPFEFEETAKWIWDDTRITYYHAGIENRFSENYLRLCGRLEKNIRRLGSFCLTKAVLEQKGFGLPKLSDLSILELVKMVSYHLRKCHAAFQGCYYDNNVLGMSYLNWEYRWFDLGTRLKATGVKIDKILSGQINADSLLEQTEKFKGEPRTNDRPENDPARSLRLNASALPLDGSIARNMLRAEKEQAAEEAKRWRELGKELNSYGAAPFEPAKPFGPPQPFGPLKEFLSACDDLPAPGCRSIPEEDAGSANELPPEQITAAEARTILLRDAERRGDQEALQAIPGEDLRSLQARWERYLEKIERNAGPPVHPARNGPAPDIRKKLREKRKKKKTH